MDYNGFLWIGLTNKVVKINKKSDIWLLGALYLLQLLYLVLLSRLKFILQDTYTSRPAVQQLRRVDVYHLPVWHIPFPLFVLGQV